MTPLPPAPHPFRRAAAAAAVLALAAALAGCAGAPQPRPPAPEVAGATPAPGGGAPVPPPGAGRAANPPPAGIVSVTYDDPARFSDARQGAPESPRARRAWVNALCLHLSEGAAAALPEGQRLEVRITDVQRAGGFEPARGAQAGQVRIVRDVYPPRIDLEFKRLGADGTVLQSGRRTLRDPAFMERGARGANDPLRYEKNLLDDWVRREFGGR
ncbi:DUF3016 domain-containing protein [Paracidovorax konjaci]|uniref:DUF3016 domain-containing protein n=1 Tax=Paracidovorax konjaci TaxID=32040 RepID=A0A1I1Z1P5_9BURK|nr:DUF3016 domain-containing protein [Paracidovorax konjaci]SFE25649.1 Protein of unknown function [Paracidovorax konjaci]